MNLISTFIVWSWLLCIGLIAPTTLPAGGAQESIIQHKEKLADIYDSKLGDYSFKKINYSESIISPSYYKYICFIKDSPIKTSPVYDHTNQITSILDENSYPYTFIGENRSWVPHVCLPITPSMNEGDIYDVISSL